MYCSKCGTKNKEENQYCIECGNKLTYEHNESRNIGKDRGLNKKLDDIYTTQEVHNKDSMIGENYESTLKLMIQKNGEHYLEIFRKINLGEKGGSTTLGLIAPLWMLYRKMYKEFFVLFLCMGLCILIPIIGGIICIGIMVYLIVNLRKLYYNSLIRKLEKNNLTGISVIYNPDKTVLVRKLGGTTYKGIIIYFIVVVVVYFITLFFTTSALLMATEGAGIENLTVQETEDINKVQNIETAQQEVMEELSNIDEGLIPIKIFETVEQNDVIPFTLTENARNFIRNYPDLFIVNENGKEYQSFVNLSLEFKQVEKNPDKYSNEIMKIEGIVIDIQETEIEQGCYVTEIQIMDINLNNYYMIYLGEAENIYSESEVIAYGLPSSLISFENLAGGYTRAILLAGVDIYQNDYNEVSQTKIEQEKVDTQINNSYKDTFTEDVIGFDVYDYVNTIYKEVSELGNFLYDYNFNIVSGDEGFFEAVDELGTTLNITTKSVEGGYLVDYFRAEVPNYIISLKEVEAICNPNGDKELIYDEEDINYYYSTIKDGVEVRYNFSFDSLRMENPDVNSITILAK